MNTKILYFASILTFTMQNGILSAADTQSDSLRLINQTYRPPTKSDVEKYQEIYVGLDLIQTMLDRFGYRCEGAIFHEGSPEWFESIHAVDRELDAVRHIVRRRFADNDDPILTFSLEHSGGYSDNKTGNAHYFPATHDRLRIHEQVFLSSDASSFKLREQLKLTGQDRNFDPITCSVLPYSNFFSGGMSKRRLAKVYDVEKLRPDTVSVAGSSFITRNPTSTSTGISTGVCIYKEFINELPRTYEVWRILGDSKQLLYRTVTEWKSFEEMHLPIRIEAVQMRGSKMHAVFEARLEWKFHEDLPQRLFEVRDVKSPKALEWD